MYKHIIWDFDGTLFDTYPVMGRIFKGVLEEEGIAEPLDEIVKHMKVSMSHALQYYEEKYQIDQKCIGKYHKQRNDTEINISRPFEGIEEICKYIHVSNRKNYLYTHRGESAIQLLKMYGLYDYFTDFITSQQGFERKPSPEAITYLIEKHRIIDTEAIMIGDRDLDILAAKNAGIDACLFTDRNEKHSSSDFMINKIQQLYSII
ncbi:Fructose-1-phosphate phosphatase YqaB [Paenibacillus allorhizoplanae]|uniref:Fructose-1-phosphate phosphatase YqaB n=1 Tax=Paenibacillus allorhizoplanae TaxID=2905648 RepID=A0ABN8GZH0_9BACL|nr:HAD-IA family hydrolase [Paenibacillus allorhizoplanae]CAH1222871.1 Fructose-1-phosphate phosphatase YqaB [Paenibacillus allorhizoplanae]